MSTYEISMQSIAKVGVEEIDSQHRVFVGLVNRVSASEDIDEEREALKDLLEQLLLYARFHFKTEESLMRSVHYPGLETHHHEHAKIEAELGELYRKWTQGETTKAKFTMFLWTWFVDHVNVIDQEFGAFVQKARA